METKSIIKKNNSLNFLKGLRNDEKKAATENENFNSEDTDSIGILLLILTITFICYSTYIILY